MMLGRDYALQPSTLALPAFDYVALGHIHKHQCLIASPPVVYPGSLQRVDFSEEDDRKGFCVVDIDPDAPRGQRTRWEHVPTDARRFLTIEVTVPPESQDPTTLVLERIAQRDFNGRRRPCARHGAGRHCRPRERARHPRGIGRRTLRRRRQSRGDSTPGSRASARTPAASRRSRRWSATWTDVPTWTATPDGRPSRGGRNWSRKRRRGSSGLGRIGGGAGPLPSGCTRWRPRSGWVAALSTCSSSGL